MAIRPPSDIIMDVARAADPLEFQASVEKLRNAKSAVRAANQQISSVNNFAQMAQSTPVHQNTAIHKTPDADAAKAQKTTEAFKKFEGFMLQSMMKYMFTSDTPSVYGKGQAGEIWKSMMIEAMANETAEAGGIGIAKMLEKDMERKSGQPDTQTDSVAQLINQDQINRTDQSSEGLRKQAVINGIVQSSQLDMIRDQLDSAG